MRRFASLGPFLGLVGSLALAMLLRSSVAAMPLERDEGEYAYIAQRWLLNELPYKSSFDQKPPGVFFLYREILRWGGENPSAIHWAAQIYSLGTLTLLFLIGRRLDSSRVGAVASTLAAFMLVDHSVLGNATNTETFMVLPLCAAMLALLHASSAGVKWCAAAGLASGVALVFKQTAVTTVALYALLAAFESPRWRRAFAFASGLVVPLAATAFYFWHAGAWDEFMDCVVVHNVRYVSQTQTTHYPAMLWLTLPHLLRSFAPIAVGLIVVAWSDSRSGGDPAERRATGIAWAWLAFSLWGVMLGGRFFAHYFVQAVPAAALLAARGFCWIGDRLAPRRGWAPAVVTVAAVAYGVCTSWWYYRPDAPEPKSRYLYGLNPFGESPSVGAFLASHSAPDEQVFILGSEPQILFYARRRSASRYIFSYPLTTGFAEARGRQQEVLRELDASLPRFIVAVFLPSSFNLDPRLAPELVDGVRDRLERSYRFVGAVPLSADGRIVMRDDEAVLQKWREAPLWYGVRQMWASLAVWERLPAVVKLGGTS